MKERWGYPQIWFDVGIGVLLSVAVLAGIVIAQWMIPAY